MLVASDPVHGTASSFGAEREIRRHIGDYTLFLTGMYPESMHLWRSRQRESFVEMVRAGKESYYVVSTSTCSNMRMRRRYLPACPDTSSAVSTGSRSCGGTGAPQSRFVADRHEPKYLM